MKRDKTKLISRAKKLYRAWRFPDKYGSWDEFLREDTFIKYFFNGGNPFSYKAKRVEEKKLRLDEKREAKVLIEKEVLEHDKS